MFDILFVPYRDLYFWRNFGSAVRDLQFLEVLLNFKSINNITVLNRPVSIYERLLGKRKKKFSYPKIDYIDITSFDIFGPIKKRAWTSDCYNNILKCYIEHYLKNTNSNKLIIIDFTPIAMLPVIKSERVIYWYDMIDNFTKHNCYNDAEKNLVMAKYQHVAENYDFFSCVTQSAGLAIKTYKDIPNYEITNGVFNSIFANIPSKINLSTEEYDFGFVGFITDKFDVEYVAKLAKSYSVVVYGEAYNKDVTEKLVNAGVVIKGKFRYDELPILIHTFKIGMLPYLLEKSHDGSPLKMYEYLKYNRPCITSIDYEFKCDYVINYNKEDGIDADLKFLFDVSGEHLISQSLPTECFLEHKIMTAFKHMISQVC